MTNGRVKAETEGNCAPSPHLLFQGLDDRPVSEGLDVPLVCYLCFLNIFREQEDSKRKY